MTCGQIIKDEKIMTFSSQRLDYMATDIACAAGNKYSHSFLLSPFFVIFAFAGIIQLRPLSHIDSKM